MELVTDRLRLCPLTSEQLKSAARTGDAGLVLELPCEKLPRDQRLTHRRIYLAKHALASQNPAALLLCTAWQMISLKTGELIGEAGFKGPPQNGEVEIGYNTRRPHRNMGYMAEAVRALAGYAFSQPQFPVEVIAATTKKDNIPSHRVLEKCGFVRGGMRNGLWLWFLRRNAEQDMLV